MGKSLGDRVVLKRRLKKKQRKPNRLFRDRHWHISPQQAEGCSRKDPAGVVDGKEAKMEVMVGDKAFIPNIQGTEVKMDGYRIYHQVKQNDILALLNNKQYQTEHKMKILIR